MAFPASAVLDNFNRANGAIGSSWTTLIGTELQINENTARIKEAEAGPSSSYWNASRWRNVEAYCTIKATGDIRLYARMTGANGNGYAVRIEGRNLSIRKITTGTSATLRETTLAASAAVEDKLGIEVNGTTITAWYKTAAGSWERNLEATDATYEAAGYIGLYLQVRNARADDFGGGPIGGANLGGAAALRGTGTLASGAHKETKTEAAGRGIGALVLAGIKTGFGVAPLRGIGSLATTGTSRTTFGAAVPRGVGALAATGPVSRSGAARTAGTGSLTAGGYVTHRAAAPLTGSGALTGEGHAARNITGAAALSGSGRLAASGARALFGVVVLSGLGSVRSAGNDMGVGASALRGVGSLAGAGFVFRTGASALRGAGTLSGGSGSRSIRGAPLLAGLGTLRGTPAAVSRFGVAILPGHGELSAELVGYFNEVAVDFPSAWFHLDERIGAEALDVQGGAAGTYVGEYTLNQASLIFGTADASAAFRRNAYVRVADRAEVDPADNFTIECWIYPTAYVDGSRNGGTFFDKGAGAFIFRFEATNDGYFILRRNEVQTIVRSTVRVELNKISHVAAKKAGSTVRLFLNGRDVTGTVTNSTMVTNERPLTIGAADAGIDNYFEGRIDEVVIYETGLNDSRIVAHYNAGKAPVTGEASLRGVGTLGTTAGAIGRKGAALLAGSGSMVGGASQRTGFGVGVVVGRGEVVASAHKEATAEVVLQGLGNLQATGRHNYGSGAALNGSGAVSGGEGKKSTRGSARISGTGTLQAFGSVGSGQEAKLRGTGTMSSGAGFRTGLTTASFRGEGSLSAAGSVTHKIGAVMAGSGTLTANGTRSAFGRGACSGTGALRGSGIRATFSALRLSGSGSLAADGNAFRGHSGAARCSGTGALVASGIANPTFPPGFLTLHLSRSSISDELERATLKVEVFT